MDSLSKIFGSAARIKIMRLFLFNENEAFDIETVAVRSQLPARTVTREVELLLKTGFIVKKTFIKDVMVKVKGKKNKFVSKKRTIYGFALNQEYPLADAFRNLLVDSDLIRTKELPGRFESSGNIKLIVLSGIFVKDEERKVDMLIVGDKIKKPQMERTLKAIESEIGKELRYAIFDTKEFNYRLDMYDQLLRDIFDYSHQKVMNKLGFFK